MVKRASLTALAVSASAAATLTLRRWLRAEREVHPRRVVKIDCGCGSVVGSVRVPLKVTPSARCCCHDCVAFARWAEEKKKSPVKVVQHRSVHMVQVFKKDLTITKGAAKVRRAQLRKGSPLIRFYAGCCGTPLGLTPKLKGYPMVVLYRQVIREDVLGCHSWVLFTSRQFGPREALPPEVAAEGAVCSRNVPVSFLSRVIFRAFYGLMLGKGKPDPTDAFHDGDMEYVEEEEEKKPSEVEAEKKKET